MKKTLVMDWVQFRVIMVDVLLANIDAAYKVILKPHGSQQFAKIYEVYSAKCNDLLAVITAEPRPSLHMKPNEAIVQIANKYLYQSTSELLIFIKKILLDFKLVFQNYVRLDFACDFEEFDTMDVNIFLKRIIGCEYLKRRKVKEAPIRTSASVDATGQLHCDWESIAFGTKSSDSYYKLYNKTVQMRQKVHKEHVYNNWLSSGYEGINDVWRLEFTQKNSRKHLITSDGEVLEYREINIIKRSEEIFWILFNIHFGFVKYEATKFGRTQKKVRSEPVVLFTDISFHACQCKIEGSKESKRSDKIFLKKVTKLNDELKQLHEKGDTWINLTMWGDMYGTYIARSRGLERWATDKLGYYRSDSELAAEMHNLMYNNVH